MLSPAPSKGTIALGEGDSHGGELKGALGCRLHSFAQATNNKALKMGDLKETYFLVVLEAGSLRSRRGQLWLLLRPLPSDHRGLPSPCALS